MRQSSPSTNAPPPVSLASVTTLTAGTGTLPLSHGRPLSCCQCSATNCISCSRPVSPRCASSCCSGKRSTSRSHAAATSGPAMRMPGANDASSPAAVRNTAVSHCSCRLCSSATKRSRLRSGTANLPCSMSTTKPRKLSSTCTGQSVHLSRLYTKPSAARSQATQLHSPARARMRARRHCCIVDHADQRPAQRARQLVRRRQYAREHHGRLR